MSQKTYNLTKQQIFDLEIKFPEINSIFEDEEDWWKCRENWITLCGDELDNLSIDFIRTYKEYLDWETISKFKEDITKDFYEEFKDKIDIDYFCINFISSIDGGLEDFTYMDFYKLKDKIDWQIVYDELYDLDFSTKKLMEVLLGKELTD